MYTRSNPKLLLLLDTLSLEVLLVHRFVEMCKTMYHNSNESLKFIMKHCINAGNSIIGKNLFYVSSHFDCNITEDLKFLIVSYVLSKQKTGKSNIL